MQKNKRLLKILFAGETDGGGANYLLAFLRVFLGAQVRHVPSRQKIGADGVGQHDIFVFSDYLARDISVSAQKEIERQVRRFGSGLLMIGGWGSFTGLVGGWKGSVVESLLPVRCAPADDRVNFPGGAAVGLGSAARSTGLDSASRSAELCADLSKSREHFLKAGLFRRPPVICGMNRVQVRPEAQVLLQAWPLVLQGAVGLGAAGKAPKVSVLPSPLPLLAAHRVENARVMSLMTDVAPHWCGGLVDWGAKRVVLQLDKKNRVEVGDGYLEFLQQIFSHLAPRSVSSLGPPDLR